jgi:hypothetical protein
LVNRPPIRHEYFTAKNLTQKPTWPVRWPQSDRFRNR